ncbi:DUF2969 family protein [Nicoliella lavandulae]|uniref:DUF2969 family protein n=1 Tax=Nicoliella lavandulae TaxID=3082954 RepID=A0ABU8SKG5_9LACO
MSKKKQNIEVNLDEKKDSQGHQVQILKIGSDVIGEIKSLEDRIEANFRNKKTFNVKSVEEGIEKLISEYHLHK